MENLENKASIIPLYYGIEENTAGVPQLWLFSGFINREDIERQAYVVPKTTAVNFYYQN